MSGYHRKHAIRLLKAPLPPQAQSAVRSHRVYDETVKAAVLVVWEAADRICGKRLKAVIPHLVGAMERHGHLQMETELRRKLFSMSAATMDRLLRPVRQSAGQRRKRRAAMQLSKAIPIKTFADWGDLAPGFLGIDFVVHGGGSMAGEYLHSLVVTDVCSGWVEAVPLLAREQTLVASHQTSRIIRDLGAGPGQPQNPPRRSRHRRHSELGTGAASRRRTWNTSSRRSEPHYRRRAQANPATTRSEPATP